MVYIRTLTLLLLVVATQATRQAPTQKKIEKSEPATNSTEPAKNNTLPAKVEEKALEKKANNTQLAKVDEKALEEEQTMQMCMKKMFDMMQNIDQQKNAAKCEKEGKFVEQVIAAIQKDDDATAKAQVEKLFTKCADLPAECAAQTAPKLIEMLRLSGATVSAKCREEIKKNEQDEKLQIEAAKCDDQNKISENTLTAVDKGNITLAQTISQQALTQCLHVDKDCAHQAAPAFLNTAMMHLMEERAMEQMMSQGPMIVLQPVIMVAPEQAAPGAKGQHKKALSLLSMAASTHKKQFRRASMRGAKTTALLQVGTHQGPWISELLVKLAIAK